ncbi:MAG: M23 family metallopeptidase [Bacillota bacterium]|nr:M23 family metallopeptidase [Bacillota bacterium]MDD3298529.1 M23 family metallopeptidase [Bacillota bacterium]MDD3850992.1 M23 family metallopeptidase [Bacillota bacterium]MDD4708119.1 M23 family metallopeptidase [Bacillota bacterium]
MKKAFTRTKEKYITVVLISGPDEEVKRVRINKAFLKSTALFTALFLSYSIALSTGYLYLDQNHQTALARIEHLEDDNQRQSVEIAGLYNYSDKVRNKMEELIEFDGEVRGMVGLKSESDKRLEEFQQELQEKFGGTLVASRGGSVPRLSGLEKAELAEARMTPTVMMSSINNLDYSVEVLSGQMDIQQEEMDKLLSDVDVRLEYLEARPTFLPVSGRITSRFGSRKHPFTRRYDFHGAVDIAVKSGTAIRAPGKGVVTFSGRKSGYGNIVEINHGYGIKTRYAHNSSNLVKKGEKVSKGQTIARVGSTGVSTGPHVHFEVEVNGKLVDPIKFVNSDT